ncbi:MAG: DUF4276 family protein [Pseudomonadota bacterium]
MTRLYVLVEGQTEDEFVRHVLTPHLGNRGTWVSSVIVQTGRDDHGGKLRGGGQWAKWCRDLKRLTAEQKGTDVWFTTMFDLYGLPKDFPELAQHAADRDTSRRADSLEAAMARAIDDKRLIPNLQRHEFEALVLAGLDVLETLLEDPIDIAGTVELKTALRNASPEDIDDGVATAPSKRLAHRIPSYRKVLHGPLALEGTGLTPLRRCCPRFDRWIARLEALAEPSTRR